MIGSGAASSPALFGYSETSSSTSALCSIHDVSTPTPADAASLSPCFLACSTLTPVHLLHTYASASPDTQESDSPLQILQQTCLEGYALTMILT